MFGTRFLVTFPVLQGFQYSPGLLHGSSYCHARACQIFPSDRSLQILDSHQKLHTIPHNLLFMHYSTQRLVHGQAEQPNSSSTLIVDEVVEENNGRGGLVMSALASTCPSAGFLS